MAALAIPVASRPFFGLVILSLSLSVVAAEVFNFLAALFELDLLAAVVVL